MGKKISLLLLISFLISRFLFINYTPTFFDSPEYLVRLSQNNYLNALISGHLPLHIGYVLIFWPVYQLGKLLNLNPAIFTIIMQIILAALTIIVFNKLILILFNKVIALKSCIVLSLLPLFWIINISIMMELAYVSFFMFSFYFWVKYLTKSRNFNYLFLSILFFAISFLTHLAIILWTPLFIYAKFYLRNQLKMIFLCIFILGIIMIPTIINGYFISIQQNINIINGIILLFSSKMSEHVQLSLDIQSLFIYIRNFSVPILRNNTNIIALLSIISLTKIFFKNKHHFLLMFLWITPAFVTNQWWDSLFYGRHSLITSFALALLTGVFLEKKKIPFLFLILYLLITSLPAIFLLKKNIPYLIQAETIKKLPQNGVLIESHFARPQVQGQYKGEIIFVDEPGWNKKQLSEIINNALKNRKPIFVSAQALSEPYGLYSGPYLHSLSLSYKNEYVLTDIMKTFTLKEFKVIDKNDNLIIYKVISSSNSNYPPINNLKYNHRRLDYYDPLSRFWFMIDNNF